MTILQTPKGRNNLWVFLQSRVFTGHHGGFQAAKGKNPINLCFCSSEWHIFALLLPVEHWESLLLLLQPWLGELPCFLLHSRHMGWMGVDKSAEVVMGIAVVAKVALQMVAELDLWKQKWKSTQYISRCLIFFLQTQISCLFLSYC